MKTFRTVWSPDGQDSCSASLNRKNSLFSSIFCVILEASYRMIVQ